MKHYRVSFYNELPGENGHIVNCRQRSIEIDCTGPKDRAAEIAKQQFAVAEGICHWRIHATRLEVEEFPDARLG